MSEGWRQWTPVLGVKDARVSTQFYCDVLGFEKRWEHRFDPAFPAYVGLSRDSLSLHLSEHDTTGHLATLVVSVANVDETYSELSARGLEADAPPEDRPYGVRDFTFTDPDGHRIVVASALSDFDTAPGRDSG